MDVRSTGWPAASPQCGSVAADGDRAPERKRRRPDPAYWPRLPLNWFRQVFRNGHDILRVWDIVKWRPLPAGLVEIDHPWVTGIDPASGREIWPQNVIYRSPRPGCDDDLADDDALLLATGRFMAHRVRQSAVLPEIPVGPGRRMPHAINYMHGSSHYNSGVILLNDLQDAFRHVTDPRFCRELRRFVARERREVLLLLRRREYEPKEYACFSCCVRTMFPWFCNANGPQARVLWGNAAPFPAANIITGHWADDVYALKASGGAAAVVRQPIAVGTYFTDGDYGLGRASARWPERVLAWGTHLRVKARGERGGMFFVDRRRVYADQIRNRQNRGLRGDRRARF